MTSTSLWDEFDVKLFAVMHDAPSTPAELIEATGLPADVVKSALDAYMRDGAVTRPGLIAVHYELTLVGLRRLREHTPALMAKAA